MNDQSERLDDEVVEALRAIPLDELMQTPFALTATLTEGRRVHIPKVLQDEHGVGGYDVVRVAVVTEDAQAQFDAKLQARGRLNVPAEVRELIGADEDDVVQLWIQPERSYGLRTFFQELRVTLSLLRDDLAAAPDGAFDPIVDSIEEAIQLCRLAAGPEVEDDDIHADG